MISDLHFMQIDPAKRNEYSHISVKDNCEVDSILWSELLKTVKRHNLQADLLICAGDITNHASPVGLKSAWHEIINLGKLLNCDLTACTTGNHDISSRGFTSSNSSMRTMDYGHGPFEPLRSLTPPYPIYLTGNQDSLTHKMRIEYFGAHFTLHESDTFRLVVFNSCAQHTFEEEQNLRGQFTPTDEKWIEEALSTIDIKDKKLNIFLTHHLPLADSTFDRKSYDFIQHGDRLLKLLAKYGEWLFIHGHKHCPKITRQQIGLRTHSIVSIGSLSALFNPDENLENHFYFLDINSNGETRNEGFFDVWKWHIGDCVWERTHSLESGIFTGSGLGEIPPLKQLISEIEEVTPNFGKLSWVDLTGKIVNLKNATKEQLEHLIAELEKINIEVAIDEHGQLSSVERLVIR